MCWASGLGGVSVSPYGFFVYFENSWVNRNMNLKQVGVPQGSSVMRRGMLGFDFQVWVEYHGVVKDTFKLQILVTESRSERTHMRWCPEVLELPSERDMVPYFSYSQFKFCIKGMVMNGSRHTRTFVRERLSNQWILYWLGLTLCWELSGLLTYAHYGAQKMRLYLNNADDFLTAKVMPSNHSIVGFER